VSRRASCRLRGIWHIERTWVALKNRARYAGGTKKKGRHVSAGKEGNARVSSRAHIAADRPRWRWCTWALKYAACAPVYALENFTRPPINEDRRRKWNSQSFLYLRNLKIFDSVQRHQRERDSLREREALAFPRTLYGFCTRRRWYRFSFFFSFTVHLYGRRIRDWLVPRKSYILRICNGSERRKWNSRL